MKAIIENGKIYNFVDDGYIAGNKEIDGGTHPTIQIKEIKGFGWGRTYEKGRPDDVELNKTREKGVFRFYLDDKGIVQMLKIEEQPEFKIYQANQRAMAYEKTDAIKLKADELKLRGEDAAAQEMYTQWLAAKDEVRIKFPYGA